MLQVTSRSSLAKTRRRAKARGFRVLNDGCGCYSVIDTKIEPPRPLGVIPFSEKDIPFSEGLIPIRS